MPKPLNVQRSDTEVANRQPLWILVAMNLDDATPTGPAFLGSLALAPVYAVIQCSEVYLHHATPPLCKRSTGEPATEPNLSTCLNSSLARLTDASRPCNLIMACFPSPSSALQHFRLEVLPAGLPAFRDRRD